MDETRQARAALTALADRGVGDIDPPPLQTLRGRPARRRPLLAAAAAVGVVLAVVVPLAVFRGSPSTPPTPLAHGRPPAPWPTAVTYPTSGPGTVAALRREHWSTLPEAPIAARDYEAGVWTGSALIVWGGSDGAQTYADGAAYDPATKTWAKLPAAPISARAAADYVWTGEVLFIWGGSPNQTNARSDGAVYDPATRQWTKLPPPPSPGKGPSSAVWTGSAVVLLTSARSDARGNGAEVVCAQSYDPAHNAWTTLPKLEMGSSHGLGELSAVAVGGHVFVWAMWSHTVPLSKDGRVIGSSTRSGVDGYQLDTRAGRWSSSALVPPRDGPIGVQGPLWTGREILVPALSTWCGRCSPAPTQNPDGLRMDPRTSTTRALPHYPGSDLARYVWTGSALLGVSADESVNGQTLRDAAAWNPRTNAWTKLPRAPLSGNDPVAVWTGTSLLVWGQLYASGTSAPTSSSGLRFGP